MVLHSSLSAAVAAAHRHDLLVEAERYRTATTHHRALLRRIVGGAPDRPDPPAAHAAADKSDANRRYAMSR